MKLSLARALLSERQAAMMFDEVRWPDGPVCPYCKLGDKISDHPDDDNRRSSRWQCHICQRAFSSTVGTFLKGSHISLDRWFMALAALERWPEISTTELAKRLGIKRRATICSMKSRIEAARSNAQDAQLVKNILDRVTL